MVINKTKLKDVFVLTSSVCNDERGRFVKTFNERMFKQAGLEYRFLESFYSVSKKDVIRGMHFQVPPFEAVKLVYVVDGTITDVVLDIRKGSPTYGGHISIELTGGDGKCLYIPPGCTHGFLVRSNSCSTFYMQSSIYSRAHDTGVRWNSFGMNWGITAPILSERDKVLPPFSEINSPF